MSVVKPFTISTDTFKPDLFKGKVLFCTGGESGQRSRTAQAHARHKGRSGICYNITEAVMRHGANAVIVGRE
jgi:peroxisomal 2,4-dienoyl-CoA reductase